MNLKINQPTKNKEVQNNTAGIILLLTWHRLEN